MRLRFVKVAGVRVPCVTLAGMARIVFVAAFICFLCRFWEYFAGGMLMSVLVLIGMMRILGDRGREQPFWYGFEAIGAPLLVAYLVGHGPLFVRLIVPWTNLVFRSIDGLMAGLPSAELHHFYRQHLFINTRRVMTVAEVVGIQEVSFGLPMLLLGAAGGLVAVYLSRSRSSLEAEECPVNVNPQL